MGGGARRSPRRRGALVAWLRPAAWPVAAPLPRCSGASSPAVARWVSRPPRRRRREPLSAGGRARSCARSRAGPGASSRPSSGPRTTGCRPTTSRKTRSRSSPTARRRPTSASTCSRRSPRATSAGSAPLDTRRAARGDARDDARASSASAATSTTGTTRATLRAARAAVRLDGGQRQPRRPSARARARPAASWSQRRSLGRAALAGHRRRARARRARPRRARRRPTAPDGHRAASSPRPSTPSTRRSRAAGRPAESAARLAALAACADTLADIARTLTPSGDGGDERRRRWPGPRRCARRSPATRATSTR